MSFNAYRSPPRRYNQANESGWVQNLLGKTLGISGPQVQRLPLTTKIIAVSSFAAMLAQPVPNLQATTLKAGPKPFSQSDWQNPQRRVSFRQPVVYRQEKTLAAYELNLEAGSYSVTGAALTTLADRTLNLEAGTYATSGADLTPLAGRSLNLEAGAYATTGADLTVAAGRTLNLEAGTYAITGADITFDYVPSVAAPFHQPDWRNPNLRPLNLAAYGYTVRLPEQLRPFVQTNWPNPLSKIRIAYRPPTMFRPEKTVINAYSLDLESGVYTLTGADAVLAHSGTPTAYDLTLDAGSYALTGADLTTQVDRVLNLEVGAYAITGADLGALVGRALNLEVGSYAITGADLTTAVVRTLNLEPGTYTITGAAATLQGPSIIGDGDEVEVLIAPNGIACTVLTDSGTEVRVVISSTKQIHVLTEGGTPIKVKI